MPSMQRGDLMKLEDIIQEDIEENQENVQDDFYVDENLEQKEEITNNDSDFFSKIKRIFLIKSVDKSLEEYENHALNVAKSESNARFLRGFEGFVDDLNLAIIDVFIGLIGMLKDKNNV